MRIAPILAVLAVLPLWACASEGADGAGGPDGPPGLAGAPGAAAMLFISPSGEPFRAQPGEPYPVAAWFAQADANHDGFVTMEEAMGISSTLTPDLFAKADANGDQKLDQAEYTALVGLTAAITSDKADSGASSSSAADTGASSGADTSSSSSQTNP